MSVLRALLFSFLVHFLLITTVIWVAPHFQTSPTETIEISLDPELQIQHALTPKKQQIVRQALVPEKIKAPDDETLARFLSEQKQRVQEETQAANSGMTANHTSRNPKPSPKMSPPDKDNGDRSIDISRELHEMNRLSEGVSTIGDSMPREMKIGSFTALNTDRYLFYTFYARMEELIRYRWETRVQQAIANFDRLTIASIGNRNWVTHIEFLLDNKGQLQKAMILKESGVRLFDAAAVEAFKDARIFPNPPQEMVQDDGFIHIKFSFTVNYNPPALVNSN